MSKLLPSSTNVYTYFPHWLNAEYLHNPDTEYIVNLNTLFNFKISTDNNINFLNYIILVILMQNTLKHKQIRITIPDYMNFESTTDVYVFLITYNFNCSFGLNIGINMNTKKMYLDVDWLNLDTLPNINYGMFIDMDINKITKAYYTNVTKTINTYINHDINEFNIFVLDLNKTPIIVDDVVALYTLYNIKLTYRQIDNNIYHIKVY